MSHFRQTEVLFDSSLTCFMYDVQDLILFQGQLMLMILIPSTFDENMFFSVLLI